LLTLNKNQKGNIESDVAFFLYFLTAVIVILVFLPCLQAGFLNIDDQKHFLENHAVLDLSAGSVQAIFTQTVNNVYIPLTSLSFAIEHHFFGFNAFVFHLDNLVFHVINVLLVLLLAQRMGLSTAAAFLAALIFGVHPMKVESVAWVTERKDVLYALFYLLALHQYWSYLKTRSIKNYLGTLFLGFVSILAKPMALSLPLVLLLLDYLQGRRWDKNVFIEKIPFFLYAVEIASLSYVFNMRNPISDILQAALIWTWSFNFYICKFLWPFHVSFVYLLPHPIALSNWPYALSLGMFILIIGILIRWRKNRFMIFAFAFYILSIFFILRFDEKVDFTVVSDRFMYLPCLGFCLGAGFVLDRWGSVKYLKIGFILIFTILGGVLTFKQCRVWHDPIIFWDEVVREYPKSFEFYFYRGQAYIAKGENNLALADFSKVIELNPLLVNAYNNRGVVYLSQGKYKEALADINRAIQLDPSDFDAYIVRANIEEKNKEFDMATKDFTYAQQLSGVSFANSLRRVQEESK